MEWIKNFQLFLFDFDGLLVNSEHMHYMAYQKMCQTRGYLLPWNFNRYCLAAHYSSEKLKESIYEEFPKLQKDGPNWDILYEEKKRALNNFLKNVPIAMMPGATELLLALEKEQIQRCVVTNSTDEQIEIIKKKNPVLNTIPNWFTRGSYFHPKPHPECYLKAIEKLGKKGDKIIGFEDTPKGLRALMQTMAKPIFVTQVNYPETAEFVNQGAVHIASLDKLSVINPH